MNIPYWLLRLLPMWDYICPKCKGEVEKNSHTCPHCGEQYGIPLRVPPKVLKDPKELEKYVHEKIFTKVSAWQREYLTQYFTTIFSDGQVGSTMETAGDFSAWTSTTVGSGNTLEVIAGAAHHGNNGAHSKEIAWVSSAYAQKNLGVNYTTIFARAYLKFITLSVSSGYAREYVVLRTSGTGRCGSIQVYNDGGTYKWRLAYYNGSLSYTLGSACTTGQWYCAEIRQVFNASNNGEATLYVDGNIDVDVDNLNNNLNCRYVDCGQSCPAGGGGTAAECYWDCVVVADVYIGVETGAVERIVFESLGSVSDSVAINLRRVREISESSISFSDDVAAARILSQSCGESLGVPSDVVTAILTRGRQISESSVSVEDSVLAEKYLPGGITERNITENLSAIFDSVALTILLNMWYEKLALGLDVDGLIIPLISEKKRIEKPVE